MLKLIAAATLLSGVSALAAIPGFDTSTRTALHRPNPAAENLTVMMKNQAFPFKARMTMDPCAAEACIDI